MKKFIYCLLPLIALQLNSCSPTKAFSREAIPEEPKDLTVVTGFKNRITYQDGLLNDATSATYDDNKRPVILSSLKASKQGAFMASNDVTEYKYNKDGLLTYESVTTYAITGNITEIKQQDIHELEYDNHKNVTKETNTHRKYNGEEVDESVDVALTSYIYDKNGNLTNCVDTHTNPNEEIDFKRTKDYTYDEKQRLIKVEAKVWSNEDYDNPEGFTELLKESHKYEGKKITDFTETLEKTGDEFKTTEKTTKICEYDSKYNLIHGLYYNYNIEDPLKSATMEVFYEYNNKGLETFYRSYKTSSAQSTISDFEYRITTYCGTNNDKLESLISVKSKVNKFTDSNAEFTSQKTINNYYDNKQRVIKQEICSDEKSKKNPNQATYLFEY